MPQSKTVFRTAPELHHQKHQQFVYGGSIPDGSEGCYYVDPTSQTSPTPPTTKIVAEATKESFPIDCVVQDQEIVIVLANKAIQPLQQQQLRQKQLKRIINAIKISF